MAPDDPQRQLASALGRIPSGLFVVTVRHGKAETGMLASWVQQCSFEPPQISLAIKHGRDIGAWLSPGATFTVNILDDSQTDMIVHFGRGFALDQPAFEDLEIERPAGIAPVLSEALAYLVCQVVTTHPVGDHDLLIARVVRGKLLGEGVPMAHIRKRGFQN